MEDFIIVICLEGAKAKTESMFFSSFINDYNHFFKYFSFDALSEPEYEKFIKLFNDKMWNSNNNQIKKWIYIIYDDDASNKKISINETAKFISDWIKSKNKNNEVFEIYDCSKSFDFFLASIYYYDDFINFNSKEQKKKVIEFIENFDIKSEKIWRIFINKFQNIWKDSNVLDTGQKIYKILDTITKNEKYIQCSNFYKIIIKLLEIIKYFYAEYGVGIDD